MFTRNDSSHMTFSNSFKFLRRSMVTAIAGAVLATSAWANTDLTLTQSWKAENLATPESALATSLNGKDVIFVSLIDGQGADVDNKGNIALLATDGTIIDADFITGLNAPKGMARVGNLLYVSDITRIHIIDIAAKKISKTLVVDDAQFLNDVTADAKGRVYISDSRANRVYLLDDGKVSLYLDNIENANGVLADGDDLYVTSALRLLKFDAAKKEQVIADEGFLANLDGLVRQSPTRLIATSWAGVVYQIDLANSSSNAADKAVSKAKVKVLLDSREKINTADIDLSADRKTLYIPNFFANTVTAYSLSDVSANKK
jgi:hypothetical protein